MKALAQSIKHAQKNNQQHCIRRDNKYAVFKQPRVNFTNGQFFQGIFKIVAFVHLNDPLGYTILVDRYHYCMMKLLKFFFIQTGSAAAGDQVVGQTETGSGVSVEVAGKNIVYLQFIEKCNQFGVIVEAACAEICGKGRRDVHEYKFVTEAVF